MLLSFDSIWLAIHHRGLGLSRRAGLFLLALLVMAATSAVASENDAAPASVSTNSEAVSILYDVTNGLGSWIWENQTLNKQICRLWHSFEISRDDPVKQAWVRITADDAYSLFLDGREIGRGSNVRLLTEYDLTWLLSPGLHVLAVEGFNDQAEAGVILGMRVDYKSGRSLEVRSDTSWWVVPESDDKWLTSTHPSPQWATAKVVVRVGVKKPWTMVVLPPLRPIQSHFWKRGWFQAALMGLCVIVAIICLHLTTQLTLQSKAQQLLQLERARIARDIHDDLGAGLTQLVLSGEVAKSNLPPNSRTRAEIDQLCERSRALSQTMDEIVWAVNSRRDTLRDFVSHVCKYAQSFLRATPIRCRLDIDPEMPALAFDLPVRRNLFLAVKEALHNAAKHSAATELFLRIYLQEQGLVVIIDDNGRGFDLAHAGIERNGLTNMSQRMAEIGGDCLISGQSGDGCRVEFRIPHFQLGRRARWINWVLRLFSRRPAPAVTPPAVSAPSIFRPLEPKL